REELSGATDVVRPVADRRKPEGNAGHLDEAFARGQVLGGERVPPHVELSRLGLRRRGDGRVVAMAGDVDRIAQSGNSGGRRYVRQVIPLTGTPSGIPKLGR